MRFSDFDAHKIGAKIKVIGIGGGGGNAVSTMIKAGIEGVDFITANTDLQSLSASLAPHKIQLGKELTKGLGAGADPDIGRDAALEDRHELHEMLSGADMVFITAGMGGGTGTGGAAIVAQIAKEHGALAVGVVTKPFSFEGKRRLRHAEFGIDRLREYVDTLIVIPNQRLLQIATPGLSMMDAFKMADTVLVNAVKGISDIINIPGTINVDFADVKAVMSCTGQALMGIGIGRGENRASQAANLAISSPLLEDIDIQGATGILINITAGTDISLLEVNEACSIIQQAAHEEANIVFGAVIDEQMSDEIRVTVIATGFPTDPAQYSESQNSQAATTANLNKKRVVPPSKESTFMRPSFKDAHLTAPSNPVQPVPVEPFKRSIISQPNQEIHALTQQTFMPQSERSFGIPSSTSWQTPPTNELAINEQPPHPPEPSLFDEAITEEIDRKIDEALQMASRIKTLSQTSSMDDDLDIPAFLRDGFKDKENDLGRNFIDSI